MAFRLDSGTIHKSEKTPEGFLRLYCNFSKVGPLRYRKDDGSIQIEHVSEEELFRDDSLETASLKPVTYLHPDEGLVTPENAAKHQKGFTGNTVVKNYPYATIVATITDRQTIDAVERGDATQVSAGYLCEVKERSDGTFEQTSRRYNHLAIVPVGRAGPDVRLHIDSEDDIAVQVDEGTTEQINQPVKTPTPTPEPKPMRQITIGGEVFSIDNDKLADSVLKLQTDSADSVAKVTDLQSKLDAAEGKATGLEAQVTTLTTKLDAAEQTRMDADQVSTTVSERLDAWAVVLPVLRADKADYQPDYKLPVADIRKLAIALKLPNVKLDGKSDEYVNAVWDTIAPQLQATETRADSSDPLHELVRTAQKEFGQRLDAIDAANQKAANAYENAWKQGSDN